MSSREKRKGSEKFINSKRTVSLVQYKDSSDEEINNENRLVSSNGRTSDQAKAAARVTSSDDSSLGKQYLMWENNANVCWLDASMALLVHNRTLIESLDKSSSTQIITIIHYYYEAISVLNDGPPEKHIDIRIKAAKGLLKTVQDSVLKYLHPILKYKEGEPDSAFCSLFNLITENKSVKDFFDLEFIWVQMCKKCSNKRVKKHQKPIITLPRVSAFDPISPTAIYQCPVCKEPDQSMILNFRTLPQCLLFHFESGAGDGELQCSDFEMEGRTYKLTGVMTLEKGKDSQFNHFITHIRNPTSDTWLECNDLNDQLVQFDMIPPYIELSDVYIIMYEATDEFGTVHNRSLPLDKNELGEESVSGNADIPLIDLADDVEKDSATEKGNKISNVPKESPRKFKHVSLFEEDFSSFDTNNIKVAVSCATTLENVEKTQLESKNVIFDELTTQNLQERLLINLPSQAFMNEIDFRSKQDKSQETGPANIITKNLIQTDLSSEGNQVTAQNKPTVFIDDSAKHASNNCQNSKKTYIGKKNMNSASAASHEILANSTPGGTENSVSGTPIVNKNSTIFLNKSQTFDTNKINVKNNNLNKCSKKDFKISRNFTDIHNKTTPFFKSFKYKMKDSSNSEEKLKEIGDGLQDKVTKSTCIETENKREIFMLNLDLIENTKLKNTSQNKIEIFSKEQIKNLHSVSPNRNLKEKDQTKTNTSPMRAKDSPQVSVAPIYTSSESHESEGQKIEKSYQKLMLTLKEVGFKQGLSLQKSTTVPTNIRKESNSDMFDAKKEESTGVAVTITKKQQNVPTKISAEILAKYLSRHNDKTPTKSSLKQEYKDSNSHIKKDSDLGSFDVKNEESTNLVMAATKEIRFGKYQDNVNSNFSEIEVEPNIHITKMQNEFSPSQKCITADSGTVFTYSKQESDPRLINVKEKTSTNSTVTATKKQRLQKVPDIVASYAIEAKDLGKLSNKKQTKPLLGQGKLECKVSNTQTVPNFEKESDPGLSVAKDSLMQKERYLRNKTLLYQFSKENFRSLHTNLEKEYEPGLFNIGEKETAKKQKLQNRDSKPPAELAVKVRRGKINQTHTNILSCQCEEEPNSKKQSNQGEIRTETIGLTTLGVTNTKRRRCKSDTFSPYEEQERHFNVQAEQPQRKYKPNSVSVVQQQVLTQATGTASRKRLHSAEGFDYVMEQSTALSTAIKEQCERNLEAGSSNSLHQQKNKKKAEENPNSDCNQSDQNAHKQSVNDFTPAELLKALPSQSHRKSLIKNTERKECSESHDEKDKTIDIFVDTILHSMFNIFEIKRY